MTFIQHSKHPKTSSKVSVWQQEAWNPWEVITIHETSMSKNVFKKNQVSGNNIDAEKLFFKKSNLKGAWWKCQVRAFN